MQEVYQMRLDFGRVSTVVKHLADNLAHFGIVSRALWKSEYTLMLAAYGQ